MYKSPTRRNATADGILLHFGSRFQIPSVRIDRNELERENQQLLLRNRMLSERLVRVDQHATLMQQQRDQAQASVNLPHDPPVGTHGYGPIMIALAVNLAMSIGFRGAARAIRIYYDAFGLQTEITPHHDSIRNWSKRLGVAAIKQSRERILSAKMRVIMVDHSCQIGKEKLMVVLDIRFTSHAQKQSALHEPQQQHHLDDDDALAAAKSGCEMSERRGLRTFSNQVFLGRKLCGSDPDVEFMPECDFDVRERFPTNNICITVRA